MASGAIRVLTGEVTVKRYFGKLVWNGLDIDSKGN